MSYVVLLGRVLFSAIFILNLPGHFSKDVVTAAASQGLPFAALIVPLEGILSLIGGLSVLLGYKAKIGAWLLVLFLLPVTVMVHRFWGLSDPMLSGIQHAMFMKNISLLGASLIIAYFGSGPYSLDSKKKK